MLIVKKLENGDIPLDEAIEKFNEGMKLANECNKILEKANETITKALSKDGEGIFGRKKAIQLQLDEDTIANKLYNIYTKLLDL